MKLANSMLRKEDRRDDWEIYILPPQPGDVGTDADMLFRCVVGRGVRTVPLEMTKPR